MANIVIAMTNPLRRDGGIFPYIETFLNGLKKEGNSVLCFEKLAIDNNINSTIPENYLHRLKEFDPDLFIFFNNQFWDITKYFDVPIIVYDIDSLNAYNNLSGLKNNGRYKYFCITRKEKDIIKAVINCSEKDICYIPPFSGVIAEAQKIERNIGFCGSHWLWNNFNEVFDFIKNNPSAIDRDYAKVVWKQYIKNPYMALEDIYKENGLNATTQLRANDLHIFAARISGLKRVRYLLEIEDLGLEIRGQHWNNASCQILKAFPELLMSYSAEKVINTQTTANFYNSSKIGFCVNHIQANSGFSWRVCDILASNACLVTEAAPDLADFGFNIPTFESPVEAREQCKKLLDNENLRLDIVAIAKERIQKNYRFGNVLPIIENFVGINLHSNSIGHLEFIRTDINNVKTTNDNNRLKGIKHFFSNILNKL